MKHTQLYRYYEVPQDLINFLRKEDKYKNFDHVSDDQVYSHYGDIKKRNDKYIGIIIEFQHQLYFAPLTHDGNRNWINKGECYDFEPIYNSLNKYIGSILLCKALPLTKNLRHHISLEEIFKKDGELYGRLCNVELNYLNSKEIHDKIQEKMQACIYGKDSPCKQFRVDYELVIRNVAKYNAMLLGKAETKIEELEVNRQN